MSLRILLGTLVLVATPLLPAHARISRTPPAIGARRWVLRTLTGLGYGPDRRKGHRGAYSRYQRLEAESAFRAVIRKHGGTATTFCGFARALEWSGHYPEALAAYRQALRRSPRYAPARVGLRHIQQLIPVTQVVKRALPPDDRVLQAEPVRHGVGWTDWAVLSAAFTAENPVPVDHQVLSLVRQRGRTVRLLWQRSGFGDEVDGIATEFDLIVRNFTGTHRPGFAVVATASGAGFAPAHFWLYTLDGKRLRKLWDIDSNQGVLCADLNLDGRCEVTVGFEIGILEAHAGQPRWRDVYAWKRGRYRLANADFPREFAELGAEIQQVARDFPRDFEILRYLGIVRELQQRPSAARAAYRKGLAACARAQRDSKRKWAHADARLNATDFTRRLRRMRKGLPPRPEELGLEPLRTADDSTQQ